MFKIALVTMTLLSSQAFAGGSYTPYFFDCKMTQGKEKLKYPRITIRLTTDNLMKVIKYRTHGGTAFDSISQAYRAYDYETNTRIFKAFDNTLEVTKNKATYTNPTHTGVCVEVGE